jgi:hypothetical protein
MKHRRHLASKQRPRLNRRNVTYELPVFVDDYHLAVASSSHSGCLGSRAGFRGANSPDSGGADADAVRRVQE